MRVSAWSSRVIGSPLLLVERHVLEQRPALPLGGEPRQVADAGELEAVVCVALLVGPAADPARDAAISAAHRGDIEVAVAIVGEQLAELVAEQRAGLRCLDVEKADRRDRVARRGDGADCEASVAPVGREPRRAP